MASQEGSLKKQPVILVVDDNKANVDLLVALLKADPYQVEIARDGEEALRKVEENTPDLILLDLMMPGISGFDVCEKIRKNPATRLLPVVAVTALNEEKERIKAMQVGVDDFFTKPFSRAELLARIHSFLKMKSLRDDLENAEDVVFALASSLEAKDPYTRGHSERVALYSVAFAQDLGLSESDQEVIRRGALLHDIGKIGVRESVLNKPERLSLEERAHIRTHPVRGCEICRFLKSLQGSLPIIRHHHERVDGSGYPDQIGIKDINLGARIVALADSYDALTSNRPYRKAILPEDAIRIFEQERYLGQWDPELVGPWVRLIRMTEGFKKIPFSSFEMKEIPAAKLVQPSILE